MSSATLYEDMLFTFASIVTFVFSFFFHEEPDA